MNTIQVRLGDERIITDQIRSSFKEMAEKTAPATHEEELIEFTVEEEVVSEGTVRVIVAMFKTEAPSVARFNFLRGLSYAVTHQPIPAGEHFV